MMNKPSQCMKSHRRHGRAMADLWVHPILLLWSATSARCQRTPAPAPAPSPFGSPIDLYNFTGQKIVVFGTSLSDDGMGEQPYIKGTLNTTEVYPPEPYYQGRWSNGPTWPHYLGNLTNMTKGQVLNYGMGASAIAPYPWSTLANSFTTLCNNTFPPLKAAPEGSKWTIPIPTLFDQVNQYIVGGVYPAPRALNSTIQRASQQIPSDYVYIIEFGGNDLLQFLKRGAAIYVGGGDIIALQEAFVNGQLINFVGPLVDGVQKAMDRLYRAGARYFLLWHMFPTLLTPRAIGLQSNPLYGIGSEGVSWLVGKVNLGYDHIRMDFAKSRPNATVATFDVARAIQQVVDDRRNLSFFNTETACYDKKDFCSDEVVAPCSPQKQWMWWDTVHPTTRLHEVIAQKMFPGVVTLLQKARGTPTPPVVPANIGANIG